MNKIAKIFSRMGKSKFKKIKPSDGKKVVGIFWYKQDDTYLSSIRDMINDTVFLGSDDFIIKHFYAKNDEIMFLELVKNNINDLDIAFINPVKEENIVIIEDIVKLIKNAKVPFAFFNRGVDASILANGEELIRVDNSSIYSPSYIGTVSKQAGVAQGQLMAEYLLKDDNYVRYLSGVKEGEKNIIYYAMVRGQEGNKESDARTYWSLKTVNEIAAKKNVVLRHSPLMNDNSKLDFSTGTTGLLGFKVTDPKEIDYLKYFIIAGVWSGTIANINFSTAFSSLLSGPQADVKKKLGVIFCNNDGMAYSIINGCLMANGYNFAKNDQRYDADKYIPIVGVDGKDPNLKLIAAGSQTGTVSQSALSYAQLMLLFCYAASGNSKKAAALINSADFVPSGYVLDSLERKIFFKYNLISGYYY